MICPTATTIANPCSCAEAIVAAARSSTIGHSRRKAWKTLFQ